MDFTIERINREQQRRIVRVVSRHFGYVKPPKNRALCDLIVGKHGWPSPRNGKTLRFLARFYEEVLCQKV